jgi:amidase
VFGRTHSPWNTSLTCGGSTGGGAVALATGEVWLAHGTDHGGSLRGLGTYCSVVGLRPSPGRVTRATSNNLWSPLSVQGPMARNVPDLALFLDTMAGLCPRDPLTFDAPEYRSPSRLPQRNRRAGSPAPPIMAARSRSTTRRARSANARYGASRNLVAWSRSTLPTLVRSTKHSWCCARSTDREQQMQTHRDPLKSDITTLNAAVTMTSCPAVAVPCGFDRYGRPIGLQVTAPIRQEARAMGAAGLFERLTGLNRLLPIEPRSGTVPP